MKRWFVITTLSAREELAAGQLSNQNIEAFLPMRHKTVRRARKLATVQAPLFPGYLFAAFDYSPQLIRAVNGTRGVKYLITCGENPSALPAGFVEALQESVDNDGIVSLGPTLSPGDRVELASGPFAKQIGELLRLDDRGRVTVLLSLLSTRVRVSTDLSNLLPA